jgi:hypothetical protein
MSGLEQQILHLVEEEVTRRTNLRTNIVLEQVSKLYAIPIEQLVKDTAKVEDKFCKGILRSKQRCLKKPKENGYCGFHQSQVPPPSPIRPLERVKAPWEEA